MTSLASENELNFCLLWRLPTVSSSYLNINNNITDGTSKRRGLELILLDEKSLLGWYTCGIWLDFYFKHNQWEAKKIFCHLRAIKWIPESLAPARRQWGFFLPPFGFITHFLSLAPAEGMLTFPSQSHISNVRIAQGPPWLSASQCFPKHVRHYGPPSSSKHWRSVVFQHLCEVIKNIHQ